MFYLTTHTTLSFWLYGIRHMVKDECLTTPQHGKQIGYWVSQKGKCLIILLYAPSHDSTYHGLCYTSYGTLAEMRNGSMGPP